MTFNTLKYVILYLFQIAVLNLVINGWPSILENFNGLIDETGKF